MKILLIYPAFDTESRASYFPFGLAYIASALQHAGFDVQVLDLEGDHLSLPEAKKRISNMEFDLVGLGGMVTRYSQVKELVPSLRQRNPDALIIAGNSGASTVPHLYLQHAGVDVCVIGEGENTMVELAKTWQNKQDWKPIKGLAYLEGRTVKHTEAQTLVSNLDELPLPAWDMFPIERYVSSPDHRTNHRSLDVVASRGCPFSCRFCYSIYGRKCRRRSPESLMHEIDEISTRFQLNHFGFADDLFTSSKEFVLSFCDLKSKQGNKLPWSCLGRVDTIDEEMLSAMKKAGCRHIALGIESGSQRMLDMMNKHTTVEKNRRCVELCRKAGINPSCSFILGTPGETAETIEETVDFCRELNLTTTFHVMTPYPGSYFYNEALAQGLIKNEDKYVSSLGTATNLYLNISGMSDEKLLRLKKKAELSLLRSLIINHPFSFIHNYFWRNLRLLGVKGLMHKLSRRKTTNTANSSE